MDATPNGPRRKPTVNEELVKDTSPIRSAVADLRAVPLRRLAADRSAQPLPEAAAAAPRQPSFGSAI